MAASIVYLIDRFEGPHAGTEGQLLQLIEGLDRGRFAPTLAVLRASDWTARAAAPCPLEVLDVGRLASARALWRVLRYAARLRSRGCAIVHCYFNDSSLIAPVFRLFGMRVVVARRDMGFWHTPAIRAVLRLNARFVDRYVANSRAVAEMVARTERVAPRRIDVIRNGWREGTGAGSAGPDGPDAVPAPLRGLPDDAPLIGIVANLRPIKRIDTLIEALALVRRHHPRARAVVVGGDGEAPGGGTMRERLAAQAASLGLADAVIFAGASPQPAAYVRRLSVAVLCSESEGLSNTLIEYMQAARPIVCTDVGGNPELVRDGLDGFLVPVGDAAALADRIVRLLDDPALARRLGAAARDAVADAYSQRRMVADHAACYERLLAARPARRSRSGGVQESPGSGVAQSPDADVREPAR